MTAATHDEHDHDVVGPARPGPAPELKARHRAMWALGDYGRVADELIPSLGEVLVDAAGIHAGQRVLDVAAGTGNVARPAARTGADVTATDLTPELLAEGRRRAGDLAIRWEVADAEALPYADASFDVVVSCVGVMFAPFHRAAAGELLRVTRPGGTIGLICWTPEGFVGEMFAAMQPYAAPPPPGAESPLRWGSEAHVRDLLGAGADVSMRRASVRIDAFGSGAAFRDYFRAYYGPTTAAYRALGDDPARVAALDTALVAVGDQALSDGVMDWEYLLVTATRRRE